MARSQRHHNELTDGEGKCSVPMWMMGSPAGFCDKPAYGKRPDGQEYRVASTGEMKRMDGRYNGYVPGLACEGHGGPPAPEPHKCPRCDVPNEERVDLDGCRDFDCPEQAYG